MRGSDEFVVRIVNEASDLDLFCKANFAVTKSVLRKPFHYVFGKKRKLPASATDYIYSRYGNAFYLTIFRVDDQGKGMDPLEERITEPLSLKIGLDEDGKLKVVEKHKMDQSTDEYQKCLAAARPAPYEIQVKNSTDVYVTVQEKRCFISKTVRTSIAPGYVHRIKMRQDETMRSLSFKFPTHGSHTFCKVWRPMVFTISNTGDVDEKVGTFAELDNNSKENDPSDKNGLVVGVRNNSQHSFSFKHLKGSTSNRRSETIEVPIGKMRYIYVEEVGCEKITLFSEDSEITKAPKRSRCYTVVDVNMWKFDPFDKELEGFQQILIPVKACAAFQKDGNLYRVLGLEKKAKNCEIEEAYVKLSESFAAVEAPKHSEPLEQYAKLLQQAKTRLLNKRERIQHDKEIKKIEEKLALEEKTGHVFVIANTTNYEFWVKHRTRTDVRDRSTWLFANKYKVKPGQELKIYLEHLVEQELKFFADASEKIYPIDCPGRLVVTDVASWKMLPLDKFDPDEIEYRQLFTEIWVLRCFSEQANYFQVLGLEDRNDITNAEIIEAYESATQPYTDPFFSRKCRIYDGDTTQRYLDLLQRAKKTLLDTWERQLHYYTLNGRILAPFQGRAWRHLLGSIKKSICNFFSTRYFRWKRLRWYWKYLLPIGLLLAVIIMCIPGANLAALGGGMVIAAECVSTGLLGACLGILRFLTSDEAAAMSENDRQNSAVKRFAALLVFGCVAGGIGSWLCSADSVIKEIVSGLGNLVSECAVIDAITTGLEALTFSVVNYIFDVNDGHVALSCGSFFFYCILTPMLASGFGAAGGAWRGCCESLDQAVSAFIAGNPALHTFWLWLTSKFPANIVKTFAKKLPQLVGKISTKVAECHFCFTPDKSARKSEKNEAKPLQ